MTIEQLFILSFAILISLMIGIFLGYRYGINMEPPLLHGEEELHEVQDKTLRELLTMKMERLKETTKADFVGLAIYDVMTDEIRWRLAIGATNQRYKRIVIRMGKGIAGEVVQLNRSIKVNNFPSDVIGDPIEYPILMIEHLRSALAVPVSYQQKIYGVILLGQREGRQFSDEDEKNSLAISQDIAKELERANVYDRILHENDVDNIQSIDLDIYKHDLIQYLKKKQNEIQRGNKGILDFEVLDQSITEISPDLQETLIEGLELVFLTILQSIYDRIEISIGREGNQLVVECKGNRSIDSARETFHELYESIGRTSGSIHSYREGNGFHLVIQIPVSSFKNPI